MPTPDSQRTLEWRKKNKKKYNEYMRVLMKKKRLEARRERLKREHEDAQRENASRAS